MHTFTRPSEKFVHAKREPVDGTCPECGGQTLSAYRVLSDGGWWDVVKCSNCLESVERNPAPPFGSFVPLSQAV
jgi:transcription elongation factor Elf1